MRKAKTLYFFEEPPGLSRRQIINGLPGDILIGKVACIITGLIKLTGMHLHFYIVRLKLPGCIDIQVGDKLHCHQTLFIDDLEVNVQGAADAGLLALRFTGLEKLQEDLKAYGLLF